MEIKDSGNRREFETGAVRDMAEGKGRCDLMPNDVIADLLGNDSDGRIINLIDGGRYMDATRVFINEYCKDLYETVILKLAVHFENGSKKYGENNWQKGIPEWCYKDSAIRHYLKFLRGDEDEPHDIALVWNLVCAEWTRRHTGVEK